jgi:3-hydroxy-9,10-secoandrosta-1,3,5(10)-triene-9,17-dione monooxygenase reductase component
MLIADFKDALAAWATGVSVVTTRTGDRVYGLTVSSFTSLSLEPPLVLVCLASRNRLPAMIRDAGRFAISLLAADQGHVSAQLARSGREPAAELGVAEEHTACGLPVVAGAIAHLTCELHRDLAVGDHTIVIGQVAAASARGDRDPLLYHRRGYRVLGPVDRPAVPLELWGFAV